MSSSPPPTRAIIMEYALGASFVLLDTLFLSLHFPQPQPLSSFMPRVFWFMLMPPFPFAVSQPLTPIHLRAFLPDLSVLQRASLAAIASHHCMAFLWFPESSPGPRLTEGQRRWLERQDDMRWLKLNGILK